MLLDNAKVRLETLRETLKARWQSWLPFKGLYLDLFFGALLANLAAVRAAWERAHASGDIHTFIDQLVFFAGAALRLPWYLKPFSGLLLEGVRVWLHGNANLLMDRIGDTKPNK